MSKSFKLMGTSFVFFMMLLVSHDISARVCALKSSSGTCLFWSGSVDAQLTASKVDTTKDHQLGMIITPKKGTGTLSSPRALLLCSDPINLILPPTAPPILETVTLSNSVIGSFSQFKNLSGLDKINPYPVAGQFDIKQTFITSPLDIAQSQYNQNLNALKPQCPGDATPIDFVSCKMNVTVQLKQKKGNTYKVISQETFVCSLPNCQSLGYDPVKKKYDKRQYDCTSKSGSDDDNDDNDDDNDGD